MKSWLMMYKNVFFLDLWRLAQGPTVVVVLFGGQWLLPTFFLLALLARRMCSCSPSASMLSSITCLVSLLFERDVGLKRIHHEKWRNFDKISLKAFNQIELKKNESIAKYSLGRLQEKNMFCKHVNKSAFLFFWGNSNLFKTYFLLGSLFP